MPRAVAAALALIATPVCAQVSNLRITEVDPWGDRAEVMNTGPAFTTAQFGYPFCHEFIYFSSVPGNTLLAAGERRVVPVFDLSDQDSDLWLYSNSNFALGSGIVHGLKWGPAPNVGRTPLAASAGKWSSGAGFVPAPPVGMSLAWDGFGLHPADWYIDETPTFGQADSTMAGSVAAGLGPTGGVQGFEGMKLGDEVIALSGWDFVNTAAMGLFTVRAVADRRGIAEPGPGDDSTRWLRIRDQDATGQNRFYSNGIAAAPGSDYRWTFWVALEETPPASESRPRIVVQHLNGATYANAWGFEFGPTQVGLVVTGIGGEAAVAPLYDLVMPHGVGDWVALHLEVDFAAATVTAWMFDCPPVSLPIALAETADPANFRFCYRGEGAGNVNTMLLDDVSLEIVAAPACRADFDTQNGVQVADIFAFLRAWFANSLSADFDQQNGIQVADIFAFLRAWFAGCP